MALNIVDYLISQHYLLQNVDNLGLVCFYSRILYYSNVDHIYVEKIFA